VTRGARRHCPGVGRGVAIYATGELAKRTPEPTAPRRPVNGAAPTGNGARVADEPRARDDDRARIRALAADAQLTDAELFNVLVVAAGSAPVMDEQRAARQLERALECLPVSLIAKVTEALIGKAARIGAAEDNGDSPRQAVSHGADR